jgi:hypothetical protein
MMNVLGKATEHLGISMTNHHNAQDDTEGEQCERLKTIQKAQYVFSRNSQQITAQRIYEERSLRRGPRFVGEVRFSGGQNGSFRGDSVDFLVH